MPALVQRAGLFAGGFFLGRKTNVLGEQLPHYSGL